MFTGLIENKGKLISNANWNHSNRLVIAAQLQKVQVGERIAHQLQVAGKLNTEVEL